MVHGLVFLTLRKGRPTHNFQTWFFSRLPSPGRHPPRVVKSIGSTSTFFLKMTHVSLHVSGRERVILFPRGGRPAPKFEDAFVAQQAWPRVSPLCTARTIGRQFRRSTQAVCSNIGNRQVAMPDAKLTSHTSLEVELGRRWVANQV